ncbi:MAG: bifunctional methylenetetrahydrofolate dehydrogenase/methenyltetrahydrofolate cyclohydrolase FolD [Clostridia bacterium]|nr:bifunctional methylenetetrahydrofolate dehydrogenase/methenyltetrahydrofolate cyclohydrolase FolD [Clostridia bacterium]MBQ8399057.1 bifunctional methylenetetrahydrofolate dehydrogenase/methenyltetrahydrofolate cyclohydrolase FolD [Clostridia bacterium]
MAVIISGKELSLQIRGEIGKESAEFEKKYGRLPGLAVIIVGENPASKVYVRNKHRACGECGMYSEVIELAEETTEEELLQVIDTLNERGDIDGILVQLPLPRHIKESVVINRISPEKDVDVFHPTNVGKLTTGNYTLAPCTPAGVIEMLVRSGVEIQGKKCVVVGRSNIVGKPLALLLLEKNGTVTICHSRTKNLKEECLEADILVAAIGKAKFITSDMVKPGAVVIDVGINRNEEGKLCGDVDYENVEPLCSYITPVPGGVGPMTITMLMKNTLLAAEERASKG